MRDFATEVDGSPPLPGLAHRFHDRRRGAFEQRSSSAPGPHSASNARPQVMGPCEAFRRAAPGKASLVPSSYGCSDYRLPTAPPTVRRPRMNRLRWALEGGWWPHTDKAHLRAPSLLPCPRRTTTRRSRRQKKESLWPCSAGAPPAPGEMGLDCGAPAIQHDCFARRS